MGKGGGSSAPSHTTTESTVVQSSLPEYAQPYYERMMERAEGLSLADYTPYPGDRQAGIDPFSQSSYNMVSGIAGAGLPYADEAAGVISQNIGQAMDQGPYDPYQFNPYQFGDARQFTDTGEAEAYMSPYIENVLNDRMANIRRQYNMSQQTRDANAVQAGAFGGSRDAVVNSLAQEDLMRQLDEVYNEGLSSAYDRASTQFNTDRAAQMDTAYRQAAEDARVEGSQASENLAAYRTTMDNLGFTSGQAQDLLGVGDAQRAADIQSAQLLEQVGKSLTGYDQAATDIAYDDFLRQQGYPESQLTLLSSIMQGVPISPSQTTTTYTPYDPMQAYLGAGLSGLGLYQGLKG